MRIIIFLFLFFISDYAFSIDYYYFRASDSCYNISSVVAIRSATVAAGYSSCDPVPTSESSCSTGYTLGPFDLACHNCPSDLPMWNGTSCTACDVGYVYNSSQNRCDYLCPAGKYLDPVSGKCVFDDIENPNHCEAGSLAPGCANNCSAGNGWSAGQVGYGIPCPHDWPIYDGDKDGDGIADYKDAPSDYGCITDGNASQCSPNFGGGPNSLSNNRTGSEIIIGTDSASTLSDTSSGAGSSAGSGASSGGSSSGGSSSGGSSSGKSKATDYLLDYCRYNPQDVNCSGVEVTNVYSAPCAHGGPRLKNVGCDYNYDPPSNVGCPSGFVADNLGQCVKLPSVPYVTSKGSNPVLPPAPTYVTSTVNNNNSSVVNNGSLPSSTEPNLPVKFSGPCDPSQKNYLNCLDTGESNSTALDAEIADTEAHFLDEAYEALDQYVEDVQSEPLYEEYDINTLQSISSGLSGSLSSSSCSGIVFEMPVVGVVTVECGIFDTLKSILAWFFGVATVLYCYRTFTSSLGG